jgi:hypothetical protein
VGNGRIRWADELGSVQVERDVAGCWRRRLCQRLHKVGCIDLRLGRRAGHVAGKVLCCVSRGWGPPELGVALRWRGADLVSGIDKVAGGSGLSAEEVAEGVRAAGEVDAPYAEGAFLAIDVDADQGIRLDEILEHARAQVEHVQQRDGQVAGLRRRLLSCCWRQSAA